MAEINLLKNQLQDKGTFSLAPKSMFGIYVAAGFLIFEGLLYGGFSFFDRHVQSQTTEVENNVQTVSTEIKKLDPQLQTAITTQTRLNNLRAILSSHIFWSPVLEELANSTYKGIHFDNLESDFSSNTLSLSGTAPSYTDLAKLLLGLKQSDKVADVTLLSSNTSQTTQTGYSFSIEVVFDSKLFEK